MRPSSMLMRSPRSTTIRWSRSSWYVGDCKNYPCRHADSSQSETLKYLYLLFSDASVLPLHGVYLLSISGRFSCIHLHLQKMSLILRYVCHSVRNISLSLIDITGASPAHHRTENTHGLLVSLPAIQQRIVIYSVTAGARRSARRAG